MKSDALEAGCDSFESTLGLMDGTLAGPELAQAEAHADSCDMCGPMVRAWLPVGDAMRHQFEVAAELAKPDLAGLSNRVFDALAPAKAQPRPFVRFIRSLWAWQPVSAFAAVTVAVAAVIIVPKFGGSTSAPCDLDTDYHADMGEVGDEKGFHVHELSFGAAKGMVMTAGDDLPVIWVSEHDGA